jgi:hypothetical protein
MSDAPPIRPPSSLVPSSKRGKRTPKVPASSPATPAPADEIALLERELLRLRLFDAEFRRHAAEATAKHLEKVALVRQLDPDNRLGLLDLSIQRSGEAASKAKQEHETVVREIEARLGITLTDYSYDSDTGKLWRQPTKEK